MPKTRPRFARNLRRPNAAELTKPLAPILRRAARRRGPGCEHRNDSDRALAKTSVV